MNCRVCGRSLPKDDSAFWDGLCVGDELRSLDSDCFGVVVGWAARREEMLCSWTDPRWLVTIDAYLEAHPPQREE